MLVKIMFPYGFDIFIAGIIHETLFVRSRPACSNDYCFSSLGL